jgi:RNA polymerase sigma factor for flagellar operon FliA
MDDLRAFGREGLLDAARAFDERRGVAFDQWASLRIRSAMIDGVRRWGPMPARMRRELRALESADVVLSASDKEGQVNGQGMSESSDSSTGAPLGASHSDMRVGMAERDGAGLNGLGATPEDTVAKAQLASIVREIVAKLPNRERELVERSYYNGQTLEQAAASMGVSPSWATRVHARAIETMERELRKHDRVHVVVGGRRWVPKKA